MPGKCRATLFVPGAVDPGTVKELVAGVGQAALDVAGIGTGAGLAQAAHAPVRRAARELLEALEAGTYGGPGGRVRPR
ncbi:hypothetical protein [Streptomyces sp. NPDC002550]